MLSYIHRNLPAPMRNHPSVLYYHKNHFDVITKLPGFLCRGYFCHRCHKAYDHTTDHVCTAMCDMCRGFECVWVGKGIPCNECDRVFRNQECYDRHKKRNLSTVEAEPCVK